MENIFLCWRCQHGRRAHRVRLSIPVNVHAGTPCHQVLFPQIRGCDCAVLRRSDRLTRGAQRPAPHLEPSRTRHGPPNYSVLHSSVSRSLSATPYTQRIGTTPNSRPRFPCFQLSFLPVLFSVGKALQFASPRIYALPVTLFLLSVRRLKAASRVCGRNLFVYGVLRSGIFFLRSFILT